MNVKDARVGIIGLGYVGLPLAVEFGKQYPTKGFDISPTRLEELASGVDSTLETSALELASATQLSFHNISRELADCNVYIVTVPTPIDESNRPNLTPLIAASQTLAEVLKPGDTVIYESTVYPGTTEEVCVPLLEDGSGLCFNRDFWIGYSPERINPGDKTRRLTNILKVTSGSSEEAAQFIDQLYASIIDAGTYRAESIKVAEAAKVIENTQRDVNIALINQFSLIFNKLDIDTHSVLEAAGTKWNFLPFKPGLVGGHCISVDPYYLTHKAESVGYHPDLILAARRINNGMANYVSSQLLKQMMKQGIEVTGAKVLVMGLAFKENCPDLRNTKIVDIVRELSTYNIAVDIHDPWVDAAEVEREYSLPLIEHPKKGEYDAILLAVAHNEFLQLGASEIRAFGKPAHLLYDLKAVLKQEESDLRL
ncbi:MAG: Vi polysaccharide biosynthesis UDP-N-acetylglucosamine C-6 dehydrogenase TviB [Pseudomonadales bacterium]